jgi:hypothetical protein
MRTDANRSDVDVTAFCHDAAASLPRYPGWAWVLAASFALIYLPMLGCRFDFIDDGNLVYPSPAMPIGERLGVVWNKIVANYEHLGPFRPVLWAHWELAADILQGSEFGWRLTRMIWCSFASMALLGLMNTLRVPVGAALIAVAAATWNPHRAEIWTSLTLSEAVAMPYALFALIAAARAPGSSRSWLWDAAGMLAILAALGCKNTFMALIPVQMFLRLDPSTLPLREGRRRHGWRAVVLALTAIAPLAHLLYLKTHPFPGHYPTSPPTLGHVLNFASGLKGAMGLDFLGVGIVLGALTAIAMPRNSAEPQRPNRTTFAWLSTAALLTIFGTAVYLPIGAVAPRYAMPAVWGLDLALAYILARLADAQRTRWTWIAGGAFAAGLAGLVVANVGKQQKFIARADMMWQTLEAVESLAPVGGTVAVYTGDPLKGGIDPSEGVHLQWHLKARGSDVVVDLRDAAGVPLPMVELTGRPTQPPALAVWGATSPSDWQWRVARSIAAPYRFGRNTYASHVGLAPRPDLRGQPVSNPR